MKKALAFLCLLLSGYAGAQTIITTFYVTPPTNGCNGIWAIDNTQMQVCGMPITWSPPTCMGSSPPSVVADTMFLSICSLPCTISTPNGCFGTASNPTGVIATESRTQVIIGPNPAQAGKTITGWLGQPVENAMIMVVDLLGQVVYKKTEAGFLSNFSFETDDLSEGLYTVLIQSGTKSLRTKILITK